MVCGGKGTRLAPILGDLPKALAPVAGRPLLAHLLEDLWSAGVSEVLLLAGVGGDRLRDAAGELAPPSLDVRTHIEARPLGTAGALHAVSGALAPRFLFVLGDLYTALDWPLLARVAQDHGGLGTLLVHRSSHPSDSDLVALDDRDRLVGWLGRGEGGRTTAALPAAALTNAGVGVLSRRLLCYIPTDRPSDLFGEVIPRRVDARDAIFGYRSCEYVKDMGTPKRLAEVDGAVRSGRARRRAEAVLLDRDGVLVEEAGPVISPDRLRLIPGAAQALARLNRASVRLALVTNQAAVARGLCDRSAVDAVHARLVELLAEAGARLDSLHVCPHHPETHHAEGVAPLRGPCLCRKPSTGLLEEALGALGVPPWRAMVVGDSTADLQAAANAGLASAGLATGHGCADGRHPARPVWRFSDLAAAADWICG